MDKSEVPRCYNPWCRYVNTIPGYEKSLSTF